MSDLALSTSTDLAEAADGEPEAAPERVSLDHAIFSTLGDVVFHRAEDERTPVLALPLGECRAAIPLRALQREFGIADDTADGRMLGWIAQALDFVTVLRPGDRLPDEVRTGKASWAVTDAHLARARGKLQIQLVGWLLPDRVNPNAAPEAALVRLETDGSFRTDVQRAFGRAAVELGLANAEAVIALVEALATELAFIEALRDGLLKRVQALARKLEALGAGWRGDETRLSALTQVQRLIRIALAQISGRFAEVDAQTGEVLAALRNLDSQRGFIRFHRDRLYSQMRAWEPILDGWGRGRARLDDATWVLIGKTYQFLAPRFMPVTEWLSETANRRRKGKAPPVMTW